MAAVLAGGRVLCDRRMLQYPAMTARDRLKARGISADGGPFCFIQTALQFYPWTVDAEGVF